MYILAVDTTAKTATAAICLDNECLGLVQRTEGITHSEILLPEIDKLLSDTHLSIKDIDIFAISSGPGSFTGVRIGVSLIKGLSFDTGKPVIGVSSLDALAENGKNLGGHFIACPVMDARRSQLYNALFEYNDKSRTRLCEDRLITSQALSEELKNYDLPIYFFGDGIKIAEQAYPDSKKTPDELIYQNAFSVARLALKTYTETEDKTVFTDTLLRPIYLRDSQAEREYKEKNGVHND
jgi:tRNA threonylcarbamoyladenosine biosynthesis protein TsaB